MKSFAFARSRNTRRATRRRLHVESLEPRAMMAVLSNVTAEVFGSTLVLTGDDNANQLVVASVSGGGIAVIGNNTTINGSTDPFVTSKKIVNIIANLNGGDDAIGFGNSAQGFADQLDTVGIVAPFNPVVLQTAIDNVDGGASVFAIPGSLTVTTAGGGDAVGIIGNVGKSVVVNLGSAPNDGFNGFALGGDELDYASRVGGSVTVVGGAQSDVALVIGSRVNGALVASLGDGENGVGIGGTFVKRNVNIVTGSDSDEIELEEVEVKGVLSIVSGAGSDGILVAGTTVGVNTVINAGAGSDEVGLEDVRVRYNLFVYLEGADDLLGLVDVGARNAFLYGGLGTNTLDIDDLSWAGIRRLRFYQFQAVSTIV